MRRIWTVALLTVALMPGAAVSPSTGPAAGFAAWSPDSKQIAFSLGKRLEVMRAADGGGRRTVIAWSDFAWFQIGWAPSRRIVFDNDYDLESIDPATRRLTGLGGSSNFALSKDGRLVACWMEPPSTGAISIVPVAGGTARVLPTPTRTEDVQPDFSSDGRRIVFVRQRLDTSGLDTVGPAQLFVWPAAGGAAKPLGVSGFFPRWSPDGRWIAYYRRTRTRSPELAVMNASGGRPHVLVRPVNPTAAFSWSPDSKRLAYADSGGVVTVDLQGHRRVLVRSVSVGDTPSWSPDGSRIAFQGAVGTIRGIWVVGAGGRGLHRLA